MLGIWIALFSMIQITFQMQRGPIMPPNPPWGIFTIKPPVSALKPPAKSLTQCYICGNAADPTSKT